MALGFFGKGSKAQGDNHSNSSNEERISKPEKSYDAEAGLGRIEDPSRRDVDEGDSITIGKQIEMEAENAIKYRTCSWPKVRKPLKTIPVCCINVFTRLPRCSSPNTFVWLSCPSHGLIQFSVLFPV